MTNPNVSSDASLHFFVGGLVFLAGVLFYLAIKESCSRGATRRYSMARTQLSVGRLWSGRGRLARQTTNIIGWKTTVHRGYAREQRSPRNDSCVWFVDNIGQLRAANYDRRQEPEPPLQKDCLRLRFIHFRRGEEARRLCTGCAPTTAFYISLRYNFISNHWTFSNVNRNKEEKKGETKYTGEFF